MRIDCTRGRAAHRRTLQLCSQRPGPDEDPGLFALGFRFPSASASAFAGDRWIARPRKRRLFNNLPRDGFGTGRGFVSQSFAKFGRPARADQACANHFGCAHALRCRMPRCGRRGMCAAPGRGHVQRHTTFDGMLACGHSRSDFSSRSSSGSGSRAFIPGTRVQLPHATPVKNPSSSLRFEGGNRPQILGGAGTRDRMEFLASLTQRPAFAPACAKALASRASARRG
jgi:hypothetical protein